MVNLLNPPGKKINSNFLYYNDVKALKRFSVMTSKRQYYGYYKMVKKQKYILIVILSFIFLLMLTSFVSYQKNNYYRNLNRDYYLSITEKYIQPFYNTTALIIWATGIFFLILFTYLYFRKYDTPVYKKYSVDYKLLFKSLTVFISIFFFIGIFGEFYPSFYLGEKEISFITEAEYRENIIDFNMSVDEFNEEYWTEV